MCIETPFIFKIDRASEAMEFFSCAYKYAMAHTYIMYVTLYMYKEEIKNVLFVHRSALLRRGV